jgi:hypothetical protein
MNRTHCTLIPSGRNLRGYLVQIQLVNADRTVWLSERMSVSDAKALRKELKV